MSDLDKTSKQLIDSIRKTKSGGATAAVKSAGKNPATRKTDKPNTSSATTSKKPGTKAKKRTTARKKPSAKTITSTIEQVPFPDGSQVWPD